MPLKVPAFKIDFISETGDEYHDVLADATAFMTDDGNKLLSSAQEYAIEHNKYCKDQNAKPLFWFNYGYVITGHRAQGAQWDKVCVVEEYFPTDAVEHARWLYTSCTRPREKLIILKD